jgi:hypothetical protein
MQLETWLLGDAWSREELTLKPNQVAKIPSADRSQMDPEITPLETTISDRKRDPVGGDLCKVAGRSARFDECLGAVRLGVGRFRPGIEYGEGTRRPRPPSARTCRS